MKAATSSDRKKTRLPTFTGKSFPALTKRVTVILLTGINRRTSSMESSLGGGSCVNIKTILPWFVGGWLFPLLGYPACLNGGPESEHLLYLLFGSEVLHVFGSQVLHLVGTVKIKPGEGAHAISRVRLDSHDLALEIR